MPERPCDPEPTQRLLGPGDRVFGRYILEAVAGRGGMGVVWRARDDELERAVALKFLSDAVACDPEALRELKRETRRCLELTHTNIVRAYDFVSDGRLAAIAMEYVDGESLAKQKAEAPGGCLSVAKLAPLVAQTCAALDYAHCLARIVHRDLKPANLLLTRDGQLKVSDFGISSSLIETQTRLTGTPRKAIGTLPYMSPQQIAGDRPTTSDDVYSLGATLYELLTSKPPFFRGDWTTLIKQISERSPAPLEERREELAIKGESIPPPWEETILACLAKSPAQRPGSAKEMAQRLGLEAAMGQVHAPKPAVFTSAPPTDGRPAPASATGATPSPPKATRSHRPLVAAGLAALVVAASLGFYFGVHVPGQQRQADLSHAEEAKRQTKAATERAQPDQQAGHPRLPNEMTAAATVKPEPDQEQREHALALARIESTVDGSPFAQVEATDQAIQTYLSRAPDRFRDNVKSTWAKRRTAWDAHRVAQARGSITIRTKPDGAEVLMDALAAGKAPLTLKDQKIGRHPVRIRLHGYEEWSGDVNVKENEVETLEVLLLPLTGALSVISQPDGLNFVLAGEVLRGGRTPATFDALPVGNYLVTVHRDGWPPQEQTIQVARARPAEVSVKFLPPTLVVTSEPPGAVIFRDGRPVGQTPWETESVPGAVSLELKKDGHWPATAAGTMEAGKTLRLNASLEKYGPRSGHDWTLPDVSLALIWIKPGTFTMGATAGTSSTIAPISAAPAPAAGTNAEKIAYAAGALLGGLIQQSRLKKAGEISDGTDELPLTSVALIRGYWIGRYEVTQREWSAVMSLNPSNFKGADLPVENVSWTDAVEFCRKLTERERAAGRLAADLAYTLPTEAQWEHACQAGLPAIDAAGLEARAWWNQNSGNRTHAGGGKQPNAWGLYDLHGNVWEWCQDWYGRYPGGSVSDYAGPGSGTLRVLRGGSWANTLPRCRSASRNSEAPGNRSEYAGFRVALSPGR